MFATKFCPMRFFVVPSGTLPSWPVTASCCTRPNVWLGLNVLTSESNRATMPEMCGVACEVPERMAVASSEEIPHETTCSPGANTVTVGLK